MAAVINTDYWNNNLTTKNNGMDLTGIGTAISGVAGAIGTGIAASKNLKAVRETNAANLSLAKQQNDWNIQQWERENAYNSPSAKLERLKAAGLNPLFYGLEGVNTAPQLTSAPLANQEAPQIDTGAVSNSLGHLTNSIISTGQYYLEKKAQELKSRELDIEESKVTQQNKESEKLIEKYDQEIDNLKSEKGLTDEKINEVQENIKTLIKQADNLQAQADLARQKVRESKASEYKIYWEGEQVRELIPYQVKNLAALTGLSNAQAATEAAKYANFVMDTSKKEVEIQLTKDQSVLITRQADGQLYYNDIARIDANWRGKINCMTVITGYGNCASNLIGSVGDLVSNFWGPLGKMRTAFGKQASQGKGMMGSDKPFELQWQGPLNQDGSINWERLGKTGSWNPRNGSQQGSSYYPHSRGKGKKH